MKSMRWFLLLVPALLLGACAANHARAEHDQMQLAAVQAAAGKRVSSFPYVRGTLYSWQPLSDTRLLVYTRPNKAWLLDVGLCTDLPYATAIGLTSHVGQVESGLDEVLVQGADYPCRIQEIRPVGVKRLKQHMERRSGARVMPASSTSVDSQ